MKGRYYGYDGVEHIRGADITGYEFVSGNICPSVMFDTLSISTYKKILMPNTNGAGNQLFLK